MKSPLSRMTDLNFVILYGSQLGQAKSIAEGLFETASEHDLKTQVFSLNEIKDIEELRKIKSPLVIVTSTTGDGEAPENADKFFRKLRKKNLNSKTLHSVRYSILGLGDTNFNNFCNCGKIIHKRFQDLGATLFYPPAWSDDAVGLDKTVDNWIEELWPAIKASIGIGIIDPLSFGDHIVKLSPLSSSPPNSPSLLSNMSSTAELQPKLTLPACPHPIIELKYHSPEHYTKSPKVDLCSPTQPYPSIDGDPYIASLSSARVLTKSGAVKTTLEVTFNLVTTGHKIKEFDFEPGDAIGIICPNPLSEVNILLDRLNVKEKAQEIVEINLKENVKGKIPLHVPRKSTLQDLFTHFLDIRTPPKKAFLRLLAEATEVMEEKNILLELCSREGGTKYEESIRFPSLSTLDFLLKYPSCHPRIESMIEHLPRLIPRAYSIASSPLISKNSFTVAFNIIEIPKSDGRMYSRLGLCTGWLFHLAKNCGLLQESNVDGFNGSRIDDLSEPFQALAISNIENCDASPKVVFYKRKNHLFRLPADAKAPLVMVGPGTGVAPFIGFIEHRDNQKRSGLHVGPMTLYFGCRHKDKDFIYHDVLERNIVSESNKNSVLSQLHVTYSRDPDQNGVKYVQDLMEINQETVVSVLFEQGGYLYVCGDAKNMAKSVREKIIAFVQNVKGLSEKEATDEVTNLVTSKRYLQDIWT